MSIFDRLKNVAEKTAKDAARSVGNTIGTKRETFTFSALPESLAEMQALPEAKLADLKTAVQSGSIDEIKAKQDELSHVFEKMYQAAAAAQQAAGAQPGPDAGANNQQKPNDDGVVDADFKEV